VTNDPAVHHLREYLDANVYPVILGMLTPNPVHPIGGVRDFADDLVEAFYKRSHVPVDFPVIDTPAVVDSRGPNGGCVKSLSHFRRR
jgi:hypothetical protein